MHIEEKIRESVHKKKLREDIRFVILLPLSELRYHDGVSEEMG